MNRLVTNERPDLLNRPAAAPEADHPGIETSPQFQEFLRKQLSPAPESERKSTAMFAKLERQSNTLFVFMGLITMCIVLGAALIASELERKHNAVELDALREEAKSFRERF